MRSSLRAVTRLRRQARKLVKTLPAEWHAHVRSLPVDQNLVVYESFAGSGLLCNPEAIFRELLEDPSQGDLQHVWVLRDPATKDPRVAALRRHPRVRFVRYRSPAYFKVLATARLLVNNATFPARFNKRPGQIYLNTWHGTPLKKMGYDEADGAVGARNVLRNFMMADYLLSTSPYMSEVMYEGAYRLVNVAPGQLIEEGYPRTDRQRLDAVEAGAVRMSLGEAGVQLGAEDRVILYAPTWKGETFHSPRDDSRRLARDVVELERQLPEGHRVLVKVHQQVSAFASREPALQGRLVPNWLPTNEVLGISDVLVTDYSSIFFDFLSSGRPVLFYTPDADEYEASRGWYLGLDELPGPVTGSLPELARLIEAASTGRPSDPLRTHADSYTRARQRFTPWDDGCATRRVLDVVLERGPEPRRVRSTRRDGRRTLLVYLGGMKSNGITTSALNLVHHLDRERFDVSVMHNHSTDPERVANVAQIGPVTRHLIRMGGFGVSKRHYLLRRAIFSGAAQRISAARRARLTELLADEWRRTVGAASFDHVIDFSGYSPLWAYLIAGAPAGSRSIWLHNDLAADQRREVAGRNPHHDNLAGVFTSYAAYDHLVSVSEALCRINTHALARFAPSERFTSARNTIDHERILRFAAQDPAEGTVPVTEGTVFVTVGRLSPEKNHERLLRAFAAVHADHPHARLVIVGDGPLRVPLEQLARDLGLSEGTIFTGLQANPWSVMSRCDCFVLSSDYEGQPMVILEARVLGLPVVTTSFDSVASAVPEGEGLVVPSSVAGVESGLRTAIEGGVPSPAFDPVAYNKEAMCEFYAAIGAADRDPLGSASA